MYFDVSRHADNLSLLNLIIAADASPQNSILALQQQKVVVPGGKFFMSPINGYLPPFTLLYNNQEAVLTMSGIDTLAQGLSAWASSQQPMKASGSFMANAQVLLAANALLAQCVSVMGFQPSQWTLAGHSYGGACAEVIAALLLGQNIGTQVQICTFGSPRCGDSTLAAVLNAAPMVRYMNDNDPIPHFPFQFLEAPLLTLALGFTTAYQWSQYVQPKGGLQLASDGTLSAANVSSNVLPVIENSLLTWLMGVNAFGVGSHFLTTYLAHLALAVAKYAPNTLPPPLPSSGEVEQPITAAFFAAGAAAVAAAQLAAAQTRGSPMLYVPVPHRPKVVAGVGGYQVQWEGFTLAKCKTKSNAKTIAKYIFKMCRELSDASIVYSGSYQSAIAAFLVAASNPAGGFIPPLTVA